MIRTIAAVAGIALTASLAACSDDTVGHDAVAIGGTFQFSTPGGQTVVEYAPEERAPVADVYGESLMEEGEEIHLSDFDGEMVVLNAWGQWCAPCRSESDDLQAVHEKMQAEDIGTMLGINVRDNVISAPRDFVEDNGLTYPSIYDPPFVNAAALGGIPASVIPTTVILDREHRPAVVFLKEVSQTELWDAVSRVAAEGREA
ncbi:TlpA disulfide reductase family protein [uncultured Corynebacterium sp.]|uniref:TlpA disulfide reductase family protein n=1 Tax=uncultured Corynebacterium sp. TaxID=159447 RepID=UPI0025D53A7C|nr:TlpA disulfide reductase family protein [uncultured Corynebacterium sp.]